MLDFIAIEMILMKIKEMMEIAKKVNLVHDFDCVDDIRSAVYHSPWLVYHYDDDDDDENDDGGDENDDENDETGDANYENDDVAGGGGDDFPPR